MRHPASRIRVVLIGGPSSVGKTTLAETLASRLGWQATSTDGLARHPGRPWGYVRPHVAEHYLSMSVDELVEDLDRHHERMWPGIETLITLHATEPSSDRLILEGSAVRPEYISSLALDEVAALWLTAADELLRERIYCASGFEHATTREQVMVNKFLARTHRDNQLTMAAVRRLGLPWIDATAAASPKDLAASAIAVLFGAQLPNDP